MNTCYIFDKIKFESLYNSYSQNYMVYYPVKANDDKIIVSTIKNLGGKFEVDSIKHIKMLIKKYSVNPRDILYSLPVKANKDIILAAELGVEFYVIDSIEEYHKILKYSKKRNRYLLRLNIAEFVDKSIPIENQKWGCEFTNIKQVIDTLLSNNDNLTGVSFYYPQEHISKEAITKTIERLKVNFNSDQFSIIDIGGGINIEDSRYYAVLLKSYFTKSQLIIEPGRFLLDPCIDLECEVNAIYKKYGHRYVLINTSVYAGFIDVVLKGKKFVIDDLYSHEDDSQIMSVYVCGLTSDNIDFFGVYEFHKDIKVGDKVKIKNCGAYSSVMHTQFYRLKKPKYKLKMEL